MRKSYFLCFTAALLFLNSCYKDDFDVTFEPVENEIENENSVFLGTDYADQIYYDLESKNKYKSKLDSWDIAFSTASGKPFIKINTGIGWKAYRSNKTTVSSVFRDSPPESAWRIDNPNGDIADMALGNFETMDSLEMWVYYLRRELANGSKDFYYIKLIIIQDQTYQLEFRHDGDTVVGFFDLMIENDPDRHFVYAKFDGSKLSIDDQTNEPPRDSWDFMFTRYARYFPVEKINYIVTGVLNNPKDVRAYKDSLLTFESITLADVDPVRFVYNLDAIGYDWKTIEENFGRYDINARYKYLIRTQEGNTYKLKFTDFYNQNDEKGAPQFEFKKLN